MRANIHTIYEKGSCILCVGFEYVRNVPPLTHTDYVAMLHGLVYIKQQNEVPSGKYTSKRKYIHTTWIRRTAFSRSRHTHTHTSRLSALRKLGVASNSTHRRALKRIH